MTKLATNQGWYILDDLAPENLPSDPPGATDNSVSVILVIAVTSRQRRCLLLFVNLLYLVLDIQYCYLFITII